MSVIKDKRRRQIDRHERVRKRWREPSLPLTIAIMSGYAVAMMVLGMALVVGLIVFMRWAHVIS